MKNQQQIKNKTMDLKKSAHFSLCTRSASNFLFYLVCIVVVIVDESVNKSIQKRYKNKIHSIAR